MYSLYYCSDGEFRDQIVAGIVEVKGVIRDDTGISKIGLALLRNNLDKLTPPKQIELTVRGEQQVVIVYGPYDMFESNSFGWGRDDDRTKALAEAVATLGWSLPFETIREFDPTAGRIINRGWRY